MAASTNPIEQMHRFGLPKKTFSASKLYVSGGFRCIGIFINEFDPQPCVLPAEVEIGVFIIKGVFYTVHLFGSFPQLNCGSLSNLFLKI